MGLAAVYAGSVLSVERFCGLQVRRVMRREQMKEYGRVRQLVFAVVAVVSAVVMFHLYLDSGIFGSDTVKAIYQSKEHNGKATWVLFDIVIPEIIVVVCLAGTMGRERYRKYISMFVALTAVVSGILPLIAMVVSNVPPSWWPISTGACAAFVARNFIETALFFGAFASSLWLLQHERRRGDRNGD
jgi:hypothetical protein